MTAGPGEGFEERQPLVLLIDTSASMGRPAERPRIDELNTALAAWFDGMRTHARPRARVEVCLITFDSRVRAYDPRERTLVPVESLPARRLFAPADRIRPPRLTASGYTRMTDAVRAGLALARERYRELQRDRAQPRTPFLWILTDGAPSDAEGRPLAAEELEPTARELRQAERDGECAIHAIGVQGADRRLLEVLAPQSTHMLQTLGFGQILTFLFQSTDQFGAVHDTHAVNAQVSAAAARRIRMNAIDEGLR